MKNGKTRYGILATIHGDNESSFLSEEMSRLCKSFRVKYISRGTYDEGQSGNAERANGYTREQLKCCFETREVKSDWNRMCRVIAIRYDACWVAGMREVSFRVVFGRLPVGRFED